MQKVKFMTQEDVKPGMIVHLEKQVIRYSPSRKANAAFVVVECPKCGLQRERCVPDLKYQAKSTLCIKCAQTPRHIGKGEWISPQGYRWVNIRRYAPDIQDHIRTHLPPKKQSNGQPGYYVAEHRLVALFKYGSWVLQSVFGIHHLDGNKLNNDPSNISYGTAALNKYDHDTAYREMLFWRDFAQTLLHAFRLIS